MARSGCVILIVEDELLIRMDSAEAIEYAGFEVIQAGSADPHGPPRYGSDLPGVTTARILEQMIEGYKAALRKDPDAIEDAPHTIRLVIRQALMESSCQGTARGSKADNSARTEVLGAGPLRT
jgi:hypothetical protein